MGLDRGVRPREVPQRIAARLNSSSWLTSFKPTGGLSVPLNKARVSAFLRKSASTSQTSMMLYVGPWPLRLNTNARQSDTKPTIEELLRKADITEEHPEYGLQYNLCHASLSDFGIRAGLDDRAKAALRSHGLGEMTEAGRTRWIHFLADMIARLDSQYGDAPDLAPASGGDSRRAAPHEVQAVGPRGD